VSQLGQDLIALFALALEISPGWAQWSMRITCTLGLNALTKVCVTASLVPALASLAMMELLASARFALRIATEEERAGPRSTWLRK